MRGLTGSNGWRYAMEAQRRALAQRLQPHVAAPFVLRLNRNRRTYFSVTWQPDGSARLNLHSCFADAPDDVLAAVARMMKGRDRRASARCRQFVADYDEANGGGPPRSLPAALRRAEGRHHNLADIARRVRERWFPGDGEARISWGRLAPRVRRRRGGGRYVQFAAYDRSLDLIRVNPALDAPDTPAFYLDYLIYHELLHRQLGDQRTATGSRRSHHALFRQRERLHPDYARAIAWEREFLARTER